MNKCTFTKIFFWLLILGTCVGGKALAQGTPWLGSYGNEWLQGKYNQKWLRIGVSTRGIQHVNLPAGFMTGSDPNVLHLYYRGVEVALTSATTTSIEFFGVRNDGASDSLLYRPYSARVNPYFSTYSDEGAYFLTIGSPDGKRAPVENITDATGADVLTYHSQTDVKTFQAEYTHTVQYPALPTNLNSFMEDGQTMSSVRYADTQSNPTFTTDFPISIKKQFGSDAPKINVLVSGRNNYTPAFNSRNVHLYIGKDAGMLRHVDQVAIYGFMYGKFSFDVQPDDLSGGVGTLGFRLDSPFNSSSPDRFSVTYYTVAYKQQIDMQQQASYQFNFPAAAQDSKSKITVASPPLSGTVKFYDITNPNSPRVITGTVASTIFTRPNDKPLSMWASTVTNTIASDKVVEVTFTDINRSNYDYLIISNQTLLPSADSIAKYRSITTPGRKFKTGVFKIKDIYNQFNYGEPSPLAIRRFVDYMISDLKKDASGRLDKYLLLLGKSITRNDRVVKELPDEVPSFAFPGSDVLLIEGLQGTDKDVPAIPVGRIPAINNTQVLAYLSKVKEYENAKSNLDWRRNVAHISGGKTSSEINEHASNLVAAGVKAKSAVFKGKVYAAVKPQVTSDIIQLDTLSKHLNTLSPITTVTDSAGGLGMITYFGHSVAYQTDYNFGYASDAAKKYKNPGRYPVVFYNGCDILNVYANRNDETVNLTSSRPQSLDWLLVANKGAIAVFGNSWSGYAASCNRYMQRIYTEIFTKDDDNRDLLGRVLQVVSQQTKSNSSFRMGGENARTTQEYIIDQAQVHQTILLGDPALEILKTKEGGLPVDLISFSAQPAGDRVNVTWKTSTEVNNSHFIVERSYNAKNFEAIGRVEGKGNSNVDASYSFIDTKPLPGTSYYRLKQVDYTLTENGKQVDGTSTTSRIVSVHREGTSLVTVYPNPTTEIAEISLSSVVKLKKWTLLGLDGTPRKYGTNMKVDMSNLPSGSYLVRITTVNDDVYYQKVIKK